MLVPDSRVHPPPVIADRIPAPGALTSGFSRSESGVGPAAEKPETTPGALEREVETEATVIAFAAVPGRADRAAPELGEVVPGGDDGNDARVGGGVERERDDVARRLDLGLAEREVDHVHPVRDRRLDRRDELRRVAVEPDATGRGHGQRLVVAEVGLRRDAGDATPPPAATVPVFPAAIPATCVPCSEFSGSNGLPRLPPCGRTERTRAPTITFAVV